MTPNCEISYWDKLTDSLTRFADMSGFRDGVNEVRTHLEKLEKEGRVSYGVAQRLVRDSAWWYGHPSGPVHAPKHYERVTSGPQGWEIEFGADKFLIEVAIVRCKKEI